MKCYFSTIINKFTLNAFFTLQILCAQYKLKMKLLCNDESIFCTKTEMVNLEITSPLVKLDMVSSRLVSNGSVFSR